MTRDKFTEIAEDIFIRLPKIYSDNIDNVHIIIEDYPNDDIVRQMHINKNNLLGLYHGIPLTRRGTGYGINPTVPDKISLYQKNIEAICRNDIEISERICEVLFHELGHYFGMNEMEIQKAMNNFKSIH
jgi:predicted Zn-dependent protease with MMP-like domain